jgi:hypothetical protein
MKMPGFAAKLPDFAFGVGSFQRGQVDHGKGQLEGMNFGGFLDAAFLQPIDTFLDTDLIDGRRMK